MFRTPPEDVKGIRRFVLLLFADFFGLVGANLLFVVCSAGIVTIPAGIAGLANVTLQMMEGNGESVTKAFFTPFRERFGRSLGTGALTGCIAVSTGAGALLYATLGRQSSGVFYALAGLALMLEICVQAVCAALFPLLVRRNKSMPELLREAILLVRKYPGRTFGAACINTALFAASVLLFPGSIIFVLFIEFSFMSFIASFLMRNQILDEPDRIR